ncbi:MAG TPA: hypothetical protein VI279_01200 [Rhodocyclaceae bacterium]
MNARLALLIVATIVAGLAVDARGGAWAQPLVNLWAWGVFAWLLIRSAAVERPALLACVLIASLGEVVLSLVWGLYDYRLGNIPLFVPPGHVLLFALGGWLAARLPARMPAATAGFAVVVALALAFSQRDLLSVPLVLLFLASLRYGPTPRLYSAMFVLALAMELWGTWLGNWAWRPVAPGLGWPTLNPPFAAGAFYCVLDWLVGLATAKPAPPLTVAGETQT